MRLLYTSVIAVLALTSTSCRHNATDTDKLAVAAAFGQFSGFLLSTNYAAAYQMMSSDFKRAHSLSVFEAGDEHGGFTRLFTDVDWNSGAGIRLAGADAELRIKYNVSFGRIFHFRKEDGHWRFTDKTSDFESLTP